MLNLQELTKVGEHFFVSAQGNSTTWHEGLGAQQKEKASASQGFVGNLGYGLVAHCPQLGKSERGGFPTET